MTSPSRARPSDRAIAQAFWDMANQANRHVRADELASSIVTRARELDTTPEARAGDCDAWQRWWDECRICLQNVSTELRSTGRSDARYARLLDSMPATAPRLATIDPRPLTTKATP